MLVHSKEALRGDGPSHGYGNVLVAGLFSAMALIVNLFLCRYFPFGNSPELLGDLGVAAYLAERIFDGQVIYRDFFAGYFPASYYLHSFLYSLMGPSLSILLKSVAVSGAMAVGIFYALCEKGAGKAFSVMTTLVFIPWGVISLDVPYPRWYTVTIMLLVMHLLCKRIERIPGRWLFWSGALAGMCFLFVQNTGLFLLFGIILFLVLEDTMSTRGLMGESGPSEAALARRSVWSVMFRTAFFLASILGATVMIRPHLSIRYWMLFVAPLAVLLLLSGAGDVLTARRVPRDKGQLPMLVRPCLSLFAGFSISVALCMIPLWFVLGADTIMNSMILPSFRLGRTYFWHFPQLSRLYYPFLLLCGVGIIILTSQRSRHNRVYEWFIRGYPLLICVSLIPPLHRWYPHFPAPLHDSATIYLYLPVIATYVSLAVFANRIFRRQAEDLERNKRSRFFCLFLSFNIAALFQLYPHSDPMHLLWVMPFTLLLLGYLARTLFENTRSLPSSARTCSAGVVAIPFFLVGLNLAIPLNNLFTLDRFLQHGEFGRRNYRMIDGQRGDILVPARAAAELSAVVTYLKNHADPREKILSLPGDVVIYFLSDRDSVARYGYFYPGHLQLEGINGILTVIQKLGTENVRFIVIRDTDEFVFGYHWFANYPENSPLVEYISRHYAPTARFGRYVVLQRNREP
jgi:hypothetical protein